MVKRLDRIQRSVQRNLEFATRHANHRFTQKHIAFVVETLAFILHADSTLGLQEGTTNSFAGFTQGIQQEVCSEVGIVFGKGFTRRTNGDDRTGICLQQEFFGKGAGVAFVKTAHRARERAQNRIAALVRKLYQVARLEQAFACPVGLGTVSKVCGKQGALIQDIQEVFGGIFLLASRIFSIIEQVNLLEVPTFLLVHGHAIDSAHQVFLVQGMLGHVIHTAVTGIVCRMQQSRAPVGIVHDAFLFVVLGLFDIACKFCHRRHRESTDGDIQIVRAIGSHFARVENAEEVFDDAIFLFERRK